jgi:putative lipoprotein
VGDLYRGRKAARITAFLRWEFASFPEAVYYATMQISSCRCATGRSVLITALAAFSCRGDAGSTIPETADTSGQASAGDTATALPDGLEATFSYGCNREYRFVAQILEGGESVRLILPDTTVTLSRVDSASGAKYGDDPYVYWSKGDQATIETPQASFTDCTNDEGGPGWMEARQRGVDFRAVGQEPGWLLDIHEEDSIALMTDYGQAHYRFPPVEPETEGRAGRSVYRIETEAHRATIVVDDEPCRDSMSGWPYEMTVLLTLDGREFDGCGRRL